MHRRLPCGLRAVPAESAGRLVWSVGHRRPCGRVDPAAGVARVRAGRRRPGLPGTVGRDDHLDPGSAGVDPPLLGRGLVQRLDRTLPADPVFSRPLAAQFQVLDFLCAPGASTAGQPRRRRTDGPHRQELRLLSARQHAVQHSRVPPRGRAAAALHQVAGGAVAARPSVDAQPDAAAERDLRLDQAEHRVLRPDRGVVFPARAADGRRLAGPPGLSGRGDRRLVPLFRRPLSRGHGLTLHGAGAAESRAGRGVAPDGGGRRRRWSRRARRSPGRRR